MFNITRFTTIHVTNKIMMNRSVLYLPPSVSRIEDGKTQEWAECRRAFAQPGPTKRAKLKVIGIRTFVGHGLPRFLPLCLNGGLQ